MTETWRGAASTFTERAVSAGLVSGAAVTGLLLGIGRQSGTAWRPLNSAAQLFLGSEADGVWNFHRTVTPTGGLVVLTMSMMAGIVVAAVTRSRRAPYVIAAATFVAVAGYLFHVHAAARSPGGLASVLSVGELRALYLVLAVALAGGIRFAFPDAARERVVGDGAV